MLGAQAIEYAILAAILAIDALTIGAGAGWFVVRQVFDIAWAPRWDVVAVTLASAALMTLGAGVAGSLPALRARPAEALRDL